MDFRFTSQNFREFLGVKKNDFWWNLININSRIVQWKFQGILSRLGNAVFRLTSSAIITDLTAISCEHRTRFAVLRCDGLCVTPWGNTPSLGDVDLRSCHGHHLRMPLVFISLRHRFCRSARLQNVWLGTPWTPQNAPGTPDLNRSVAVWTAREYLQ